MNSTDNNTDKKAVSSKPTSSDQLSEKAKSLSSGALFKSTKEAEQFAQTTSSSNNSSTLIIESAEIKPEDMTCSTEATDKYSDYEIEIESSDSYEDALFSSADELDDAIANGRSEISSPKINNSRTDEPEAAHSPANPKQPPPPPIDLNNFFSQYTQEGKFKKGIYLFSKDGTHLPTSEQDKKQADLSTENGDLDNQIKEESFQTLLPTAQKAAPSQATGFKKTLDTLKITALYIYQKAAIKLGIYFGMLLPARTIDLDFNLAKLKPKKAQDHIVSPYEIKKLFDTKGIKSLQALQQAANDLAIIGKCHLSKSKRSSLLATYSDPISSHIKQLISLFQKSPTTARNSNHAELAEHSKAILKTIISGYKHIYAPLYQANNTIYGPQRKRANGLAFQLLDWICLEQLLHMAIQSSVPSSSIKTLNTIFNVLRQYEPGSITVKHHSLSYGDCSIKQLFIRYQMLNTVNYKKISTRQHTSLIEYIIQHENKLKIVDLKETITNSTSLWHIPPHHDSAPNYTTSQAQDPSSTKDIYIWVTPYFNNIRKDRQAILKRLGTVPDSTPISTTAPSNIEATLSLLNILRESVDSNINHTLSPGYSIYQNTAMKVFTTIDDCHHYTAYDFARNTQLQNTKKEDKVELPAYPTTAKSSWQLAHEDEKRLYLQTNEGKSCVNFDIAYPAIILRQNIETKIDSIDLCLIREIERKQAQHIDLSMQKIASDFTGIELKTSKAPSTKAIIYKDNKKFYLICHHNEEFWKGKTLEIEDLNKTQRVICIKALQSDFGRTRIYELF